jgi:tetratricopeptide (TPR) repeat protein
MENMQITSSVNNKDLEACYDNLEKTGKNLYFYASVLQRCGLKDAGMKKMEEAKELSSNYNIYIALGRMYGNKQDFETAVIHYRTASNMAPYLLAPRYELVRLLDKSGNKEAALDEARLIGTIPVKVASKKADNIKNLALKYIENAASANDTIHEHEHHEHDEHHEHVHRNSFPQTGLPKNHIHNAFCNHH